VSDSTNNTPLDVDRGILRVKCILKPTKAAEEIAVDFVIVRTGSNINAV